MNMARKNKNLNRVMDIHIGAIKPNPYQPRKYFDTNELTQLAKSIAQDGVLQPLTVQMLENGYELVSGERRLRAAKLAGLKTVPCIITELTERNSALMALVENLQREDLSFFEEAEAIENLVQIFGLTQEDVAIRLGMAQSTVANKLRLLRLGAEEREIINGLRLTERHARALLKLPEQDQRAEVLQKIAQHGYNVEQTEHCIQDFMEKKRVRESYRRRSAVLKDVKLFMNTVNHALEIIQLAGVSASAEKKQNDEFLEYTIRIPLEDTNRQKVKG